MRFKDQRVFITGGNSGIGQATAKAFIDEGAHIAITGRDLKSLEKTQKELGPFCKSYVIDLTSLKSIHKGVKKIQEDFTSFDVLFLNAGVAGVLKTSEVQEKDFDQIMNTNVKGPFFLFQALLPFLKKGASIIATSSISSQMGIKHSGIYSASKAALNRLMIAFLAEFMEEKKFRFNLVSPGATKTPLFDSRVEQDPNYLKKISQTIPLKRMGEPKEIASSVLFLASKEASFICGANLVVDGGASSIYPWTDLQEYYSQKNLR